MWTVLAYDSPMVKRGDFVAVNEPSVYEPSLPRLIAVGNLQKVATKNPRAPKKRATKKKNPGGAATFKRLHWGHEGKGQSSSHMAPDPTKGPIVELGELTVVEYRTKKGRDRAQVDYVHKMGGVGSARPMLCMNGEGKLLIVGGGYRVETRGIVG